MAIGSVTIQQSILGQAVRNVLWYDNLPDDEGYLEEITSHIGDAYSEHAALFCSSWSVSSVKYTFYPLAGTWSTEYSILDGPIEGTGQSTPAPTQVAILISTRYVGPPPNRGRIYLGGLPGNFIENDGTFNATSIVTAASLAALLRQLPYNSNSDFANMAIVRRVNGVPSVHNLVDEILVRDVPATQRRRRLGQGA